MVLCESVSVECVSAVPRVSGGCGCLADESLLPRRKSESELALQVAPWLSEIALLGECRAHTALRARPPASKGRFLSISTSVGCCCLFAHQQQRTHGATVWPAASQPLRSTRLRLRKSEPQPCPPCTNLGLFLSAHLLEPSTLPLTSGSSDSLAVRVTHSSHFTMASIPTGPAADRRADSRRLADFAAKAAETFVSAYYAASDSPQRTNLVPTLYLPNSSIVWNGTPVSGQQELQAMLNSMPGSKHEVHTFDCHALGGAVDGGKSSPTPFLSRPATGASFSGMIPPELDRRRKWVCLSEPHFGRYAPRHCASSF